MIFNPETLSDAEINQYSLTHFIESGLTASGWTTVTVDQARDGWPDYEELVVPGVYVYVENSEVTGFELGSHGKTIQAFIYIYGENDAQRTRLAENIENMVRDTVPIYGFVTGNETSPIVADYFETENVRSEKIPTLTIAPDKEKFRARVSAQLRRQVS